MYLGRFKLGDFLPIPAWCVNSSREEVSPTVAASYTIYDVADSIITGANDAKMIPHDKATRTGWFYAEHRLGSAFAVGRHNILVEWASGGSNFGEVHCFEIVAGGHTSGGYIGLEHVQSPQAKYVVGLLDSGSVEIRKGPSISG